MKTNYFALPGLVGLKELRIEAVKKTVLQCLKLDWDDLVRKDRNKPLPDARKMMIYCVNKYCGKNTTVALGKMIQRDHATILYYFKKAEDLRLTDPAFRSVLENIEFEINKLNATI